MTGVSQYFISSDTSLYIDRYNKFSVIEGTHVTMTRLGFWSYSIREQASNSNLDPDLSGSVLETGKIKVIGTDAVSYTHENTDTKIVYNG